MVTVISRPLGHKLTDEDVEATVQDSSGEALFITDFAHGLSDGDWIWVQGIIGAYNGYKYVDSIAYNEFKLKESENGDYVPYKQTVEVSYRVSVLNHGWLAINQPIVYELQSDLWPNNEPEEAYTARIVDSSADAEGYTQLNLSSALNTPYALDFIELVGTGPLAGAYQIVTVLNPWSVIINLAYDASNSFTGYQVVKYYNNYCINVDVYSGLGAEHPWYSEKPYTLAATLRFTPDSEGKVKFSISDILKGYIHTRNNLTLDTLPNNLDFMTAFYIAYYESYDVSDGTEIEHVASGPMSDIAEFEGHAVNADMPFKSVYISHMSDYLQEDVYLAQWLTLQDQPYAIVGYFFDISFINSIPQANILVNIDKQNNGVVIETTTLDAELDAVLGGSDPEAVTFSGVNPGVGIIRVPIIAQSGFDQYCIYAYTESHTEEVEVPPVPFDLSLMTNEAASGDQPDWTTGAIPFILGQSVSDNLSYAISLPMGTPQIINYRIRVENKAPGFGQFVFETLDAVLGSINLVAVTANANGIYEGSVTLPAPSSTVFYLSLTFNNAFIWDMYLEELSIGEGTTEEVEIPGVTITETICIKILEECDNTFIQDDDIRLTEDGDFRILE